MSNIETAKKAIKDKHYEKQFKIQEGSIIEMLENCSGAIKGEKYILTKGNREEKEFPDHSLWAWKGEQLDGNNSTNGCSCKHKWKLLTPKELKAYYKKQKHEQH